MLGDLHDRNGRAGLAQPHRLTSLRIGVPVIHQDGTPMLGKYRAFAIPLARTIAALRQRLMLRYL